MLAPQLQVQNVRHGQVEAPGLALSFYSHTAQDFGVSPEWLISLLPPTRRLIPHNDAGAKMRFDVDIVRGHLSNYRLVGAARGFRSKVGLHKASCDKTQQAAPERKRSHRLFVLVRKGSPHVTDKMVLGILSGCYRNTQVGPAGKSFPRRSQRFRCRATDTA